MLPTAFPPLFRGRALKMLLELREEIRKNSSRSRWQDGGRKRKGRWCGEEEQGWGGRGRQRERELGGQGRSPGVSVSQTLKLETFRKVLRKAGTATPTHHPWSPGEWRPMRNILRYGRLVWEKACVCPKIPLPVAQDLCVVCMESRNLHYQSGEMWKFLRAGDPKVAH